MYKDEDVKKEFAELSREKLEAAAFEMFLKLKQHGLLPDDRPRAVSALCAEPNPMSG